MIDYVSLRAKTNEVAAKWVDRPVKPHLKAGAPSPKEIRAHADAVEAYDKAMAEYHKGTERYRKAQAQEEADVREAILAEHGLAGHPKAGQVYSMAWEHGHSSGYEEVESWVRELAELVLD